MEKLNPKEYKEDFDIFIRRLTQRLEKLNSQGNYSYDTEDRENQILIANRHKFNDESVEHTEHTSAILVPEWVTNTNFLETSSAKRMFEKYYTDKSNKPDNMWEAPLILKFFHHEHDFKLTMTGEEDVTNSVNKFISYDEALENFAIQQEFNKFMNTLAEELLKKHEKEFHGKQTDTK